MVKAIEIPSQCLLRSLIDYNAESGEMWWLHRGREFFGKDSAYKRWNTRYCGARAFASPHKDGYLQGCLFKRSYLAHRIIYKLHYGCDPLHIDHIDGVRDNNAIENLRSVTHTDNMRNTKRRGDNLTGATGVTYIEEYDRWRAMISVDKKNISLGCYATKEEAIKARKDGEVMYGFHDNHGRAQ